jgi:hypothetical protein
MLVLQRKDRPSALTHDVEEQSSMQDLKSGGLDGINRPNKWQALCPEQKIVD